MSKGFFLFFPLTFFFHHFFFSSLFFPLAFLFFPQFFFFIFQEELGNAEQITGKKGTARAPVLPPCSEASEFSAVVGGVLLSQVIKAHFEQKEII